MAALRHASRSARRVFPSAQRLPIGGPVLTFLATAIIAFCVAVPADAGANASLRMHPASHSPLRSALAASPPLVFGVYPGGAAGTFGPAGQVKPEDPAKRLQALEQLRPVNSPFVLHLYASYTGPAGWSAAQQLGEQIAQYTQAGFEVELVLAYRPTDGGSSADVSEFVAFVNAAVSAFGSNPRFVSLQVTNEANVTNAPNAADGYYGGSSDALIAGVIAAKQLIVGSGHRQIKVGFNWANSSDAGENAFWRYLRVHGGAAFANSLDWVGLDAYPGTWGPPSPGSLSVATARAMRAALASLRTHYLPLAGIPSRVALHVSENGYPTGPGRTEQMQVQAMRSAIETVAADRALYHVTDYRWFDLRDADSASSSFEDRYGLMTDSYTGKLGFAVYRTLVAELSGSAPSSHGAFRRKASALRAAAPRKRRT